MRGPRSSDYWREEAATREQDVDSNGPTPAQSRSLCVPFQRSPSPKWTAVNYTDPSPAHYESTARTQLRRTLLGRVARILPLALSHLDLRLDWV